jgi:hypothetical protein
MTVKTRLKSGQAGNKAQFTPFEKIGPKAWRASFARSGAGGPSQL